MGIHPKQGRGKTLVFDISEFFDKL